MPDQHFEAALEQIDVLLQRLEDVEIPASDEFPGTSELLQDSLSAIAEKLIILRDRMTGEETSYTVGE